MILNNRKICCFNIAGILIQPGLNEIADNDYMVLKEHELFQSLIQVNSPQNKGFKIVKNVKEEIDDIIKECNLSKGKEEDLEKYKSELKPKKTKGNLDLKMVEKAGEKNLS